MTFFIIWAIVLGAVLAIGGLGWSVRLLVLWLAPKPNLRIWIVRAVVVLAATAYISFFIWGLNV